jgi:hypothetical protein
MDICKRQSPTRVELGNGHWVRCFLFDGAAPVGPTKPTDIDTTNVS